MSERDPIGPEEQQALQEAGERLRDIMKAAKVAAFNGWTIGFFAAVSLLVGLFSLTSLVVGVGLAIVARNEFKGRSLTRALNPNGLELMWKNQVGFMGLIIAYCLWSIYAVTMRPDPEMAELTQLLGPGTQELVRQLTQTVYVAVIVATALFQGLNARFYKVRKPKLEAYLEETPQWIVDVQRASSVS